MASRRGRARRPGRLSLSRRFVVAGGLAALLAPAAEAAPIAVLARRLPLSETDEAPDRLGPLRFMGALDLRADHPDFGGFSGLVLDADLTLHAVSDRGAGLTARLVLDQAGAPAGLAEPRLFPLLGSRGRPLGRGAWGDAEALARLPDGRFLIAFERQHRIMRHDGLDRPGRPVPAPPGLAAAPRNGGIEALTVLADGQVLAIAERLAGSAPDTVAAWLGPPDGRAWQRRDWHIGEHFVPVGAAALPDGGVLVLERRFAWLSGFASRIMRLEAASLAAPVLTGVEIARLEPPLLADNFEGIAVAPAEEGLHVVLISDDNFFALQRTLLLLFRYDAA
ncbi:esterase-like activity of phytase family protein [Elioraea tepidiphila]|uniref:esterase-like activity of phytase family protein n=1 Tax=Elioraea tepidiphila TaxID=457934 RepID=UPI002FD96399